MKNGSFPRRLGVVVSTVVYTLVAACGDSSEPLVPAAVEVVAGAGQSAAVAGTLAVAPSVKVLTASGKPVPNVKVTFVAGPEDGIVMGGAQVTNASGIATITSWTLGTKAGTSTLTVTAEGVSPITITATTTAGPATGAAAFAGENQSAQVATAVQVNPAIRVIDNYGNPVPNTPVTFTTTGGTLQTPQTQTDANGVATPGKWTLGTTAGTQVVSATVAASTLSGAPITISAIALPDVAAQLVLTREPASTNGSGEQLTTQPQLEFRDKFNNIATMTSLPVSAAIASGTGTLGGTTTVNAQAGRVYFTNLTYTGTGAVQLRFSSPGFSDATSSAFTIAAAAPCAGPAQTLNFTLGQSARFVANNTAMPRCLNFSATANAGQQYLVMLENLSPRGSYSNSLFPGFLADDGQFSVSIQTRGASSQMTAPFASSRQSAAVPANAVHSWEFGNEEPIYEIEPAPIPGGAPAAKVMRNGEWVAANSVSSIAVGDTLQVTMEGIARLSISARTQRAVVRLVTSDIVIAEDLRILTGDPTFTRSTGGRNTPLTQTDMEDIAREYSAYAKVMSDRFFGGDNAATTQDPGRTIAVHSLMPADNIWGYTYSNTNYFVWDYWVGNTNGSTKMLAQHAQRNADDLFMHEIAHMRHWGLLERSGRTGMRGNRWLVEGFARFSERLPIAMRLLNNPDFSRTQNVTLPYNTAFRNESGQQVYYADDIPSYLYASLNMYEGYGASAFVFDYFSDQVALSGGNWPVALRELLIAGGSETDINGVINRYLPGVDFGTLFTRARVALYTDDYDTPGLPTWTQYSMYNLRLSRPPGNNIALDPRTLFPVIRPGATFAQDKQVGPGGSFGYVIDGVGATADMRVDISPTAVPNGVVTIVRIK